MAPKKTNVADLVEVAKATRPVSSSRPTWVDKLPEDLREQMIALKRAYHGGQLGSHTPHSLYHDVVIPQGIKIEVTYSTFRSWLSGYYDGKKQAS